MHGLPLRQWWWGSPGDPTWGLRGLLGLCRGAGSLQLVDGEQLLKGLLQQCLMVSATRACGVLGSGPSPAVPRPGA